MSTFVRESVVPVPLEETFAWHRRPGALTRLMPPWLPAARVVDEPEWLSLGDRVVMSLGPMRTESVITDVREPANGNAAFADEMRRGPFRTWRHSHTFSVADENSTSPVETRVTDRIEWASSWLPERVVRNQLERVFTYRHSVLAADLAAHARTSKRLTVAISGASGFLGSALAAFLTTGGHRVVRLVRRPALGADEISWDPRSDTIDSEALEGCDALVNLSGEPLLSRWTTEKVRKIRESRINTTGLLARTLAQCKCGPKVL